MNSNAKSTKSFKQKENSTQYKILVYNDLSDVKTTWKNITKESKVYACVLLAVCFCSLVYIWLESSERDEVRVHLGQGWVLLGRKQDVADFEWTFWFSEIRFTAIAMFLGHAALSFVISNTLSESRNTILSIYCFTCIYTTFGSFYIIVILAVQALFLHVEREKNEKRIAILAASLIVLINFISIKPILHPVYVKYELMAQSGILFTIFRCLSVSLETIRYPNAENRKDILQPFYYNFYLPYFFFGPVMTYNVFRKKATAGKPGDIFNVAYDVIRVFAYVVVIDFARHFFHVTLLTQDADFLKSSPTIVLGVIAFVNFYLDWIKGRVLYAVTTGIARNIDGYKDAPTGAKNVARLYTFADTYFDRGIQHWLCRYVYNPIGKGHTLIENEVKAGATSFLVVLWMYGLNSQSLVFVSLNLVGLTLEFQLKKTFSGLNNKRILAMVYGLNYWCIILFNCVGICGLNAFETMFVRIFIPDGFGMIGSFATLFMGYCYAFINIELDCFHAKKD